MQQITFNNFQEAEEAYYKTHQCDSDDPDEEEGRIMRWLDDMAPLTPYPGMADKRTKLRIAFDVDGTLIKKTDNGDVPRYEIIAMLKTFVSLGHTVFVWSGAGKDWAENWCRKLDLFPHVRVLEKRGDAYDIDLAFDDYPTSLAKVDILV